MICIMRAQRLGVKIHFASDRWCSRGADTASVLIDAKCAPIFGMEICDMTFAFRGHAARENSEPQPD